MSETLWLEEKNNIEHPFTQDPQRKKTG